MINKHDIRALESFKKNGANTKWTKGKTLYNMNISPNSVKKLCRYTIIECVPTNNSFNMDSFYKLTEHGRKVININKIELEKNTYTFETISFLYTHKNKLYTATEIEHEMIDKWSKGNPIGKSINSILTQLYQKGYIIRNKNENDIFQHTINPYISSFEIKAPQKKHGNSNKAIEQNTTEIKNKIYDILKYNQHKQFTVANISKILNINPSYISVPITKICQENKNIVRTYSTQTDRFAYRYKPTTPEENIMETENAAETPTTLFDTKEEKFKALITDMKKLGIDPFDACYDFLLNKKKEIVETRLEEKRADFIKLQREIREMESIV